MLSNTTTAAAARLKPTSCQPVQRIGSPSWAKNSCDEQSQTAAVIVARRAAFRAAAVRCAPYVAARVRH